MERETWTAQECVAWLGLPSAFYMFSGLWQEPAPEPKALAVSMMIVALAKKQSPSREAEISGTVLLTRKR